MSFKTAPVVKKPISLVLWLGVILLIMMVGIVGFLLAEHYNFLDALGMTVILLLPLTTRKLKPLTRLRYIANLNKKQVYSGEIINAQ